MIKQETQNSAENITRPDQNFEYETLLINFQKLNIDSVESCDTCDDDWISHRTTMSTRWRSSLCKYSAVNMRSFVKIQLLMQKTIFVIGLLYLT